MLREAGERLGLVHLGEHPRTLFHELLERSGCTTARCMALMCACEDEKVLRMTELWGKLNEEEKRYAEIDHLLHALQIKVADVIGVISEEILRVAKFEANLIVGLDAPNIMKTVVKKAKTDRRNAYNFSKLALETAGIAPIAKNKIQVNVGSVDARQQLINSVAQPVIPSLEEVTRSLEEGKPIPGNEPPMLEAETD